jgi:hypothetical protein
VDEEPDTFSSGNRQSVKAKDKAKLQLEGFSSVRDASNRIDNAAIANAMIQLFGNIAANPLVLQSPQLVNLANQIFTTAGLPREFRLQPAEPTEGAQNPQEQQKQVEGAFAQFAQQIAQRFQQQEQSTVQLMQQTIGPMVQQLQQFGQAIEQIAGGLAQNNQLDSTQQQAMAQLAEMVRQTQAALLLQNQPAPMGQPLGLQLQ